MAKNWLGLGSRRVTAAVRQPCHHVIKGGRRDGLCRTPAIIGGICVALLVLGANQPSAHAAESEGVEVGLDGAAYEACLQAEGPKADVDRDVRDGVKAGLRGTPSFVVGRTMPDQTVTGEMVTGVQSLESLRAKVNALTDE